MVQDFFMRGLQRSVWRNKPFRRVFHLVQDFGNSGVVFAAQVFFFVTEEFKWGNKCFCGRLDDGAGAARLCWAPGRVAQHFPNLLWLRRVSGRGSEEDGIAGGWDRGFGRREGCHNIAGNLIALSQCWNIYSNAFSFEQFRWSCERNCGLWGMVRGSICYIRCALSSPHIMNIFDASSFEYKH